MSYVIVICVIAAVACACAIAAAVPLWIVLTIVRPWDASFRKHDYTTKLPFWMFYSAATMYKQLEQMLNMKPAPMRAAEIATGYIQSQIMFAITNLDVPERLVSGPKSSAQLAIECGVNSEWMDRVCKAAAAMELLGMQEVRAKPGTDGRKVTKVVKPDAEQPSIGTDSNVDTKCTRDQMHKHHNITANITASTGQLVHSQKHPAASIPEQRTAKQSATRLYKNTAASSVLCKDHPSSVKAFVKLFEHQYGAFGYLSQGLVQGVTPYELYSGGVTFWDHLNTDEAFGTVFDEAMQAQKWLGSVAVVSDYRWGQYHTVIDIAGGIGGFLAELLQHYPQLQGVLLDLEQPVQRGKQWWSTQHADKFDRISFYAGDMFQPSSIPSPTDDLQQHEGHRGRQGTVYTLRNILHDWPDAECVQILRAIRSRITDQQVQSGAVRLAIVEMSSMEDVVPALLRFRTLFDMNMLMSFGHGKERDRAGFNDLLEASGFKLRRVVPTRSQYLVVEAVPV
eukprot:jgi/Chrzof1/2227/Cz11g07130.t1